MFDQVIAERNHYLTHRPFSDLVLEAIARVLHDEIVVYSWLRIRVCIGVAFTKSVELFSVAAEVAEKESLRRCTLYSSSISSFSLPFSTCRLYRIIDKHLYLLG